MDKKIKYIGFYNILPNLNERVVNLAAKNKMDYVCSALSRVGYEVQIISSSWIVGHSVNNFEFQKTIKINNRTELILCPSWRSSNKFSTFIKIIFSFSWLLFFLLFNVKKNEKIIAYHSPYISIPIIIAKIVKKFYLILEVEEIYHDVWKNDKNYKRFNFVENKIIRIADYFICSSYELKEKLPLKSALILYGTYITNSVLTKKKSNWINLVYVGLVDEIKGGAFIAAKTMNFLPLNYRLSIIGYGEEAEITKLKHIISGLIIKDNCKFLGVKTGQELSSILLNSDIGLNPQFAGEYMDSAFPSKILTYLSHNLRVVSTNIKSVANSPFNSYLDFSESDSPKTIADTILKIDLNGKHECALLINELDEKFVQSLCNILEN